jgi:hypothetical protein
MNGGGYRVSLWSLNRQQQIEQVALLELELQGTALGVTLLPNKNNYNNLQSTLLGGSTGLQSH